MSRADPMDLDNSDQSGDESYNNNAENQEKDLDEKYPNRPRNHSSTLPFHSLFQELFNPLTEAKSKPKGPAVNRRRLGPDSGQQSSSERRRAIIERFISRWRREVGDDIYPAFRLIIPEKDRDRAMYGLKEKILARYLVKIMKIDKNSEDAVNLTNWKLATTEHAGNFPGRCFEVLQKRPFRTEVGDMTIQEVNDKLDELAGAAKEEDQLPLMTQFYQRMNPEELMWLIKIILRQMKVGATERTFFNIWHPDAESLFNISSSLRRVCWELHNPNVRLEREDRGVSLMQCFQPQLAQFQQKSFDVLVAKMRPQEDDREFWIEEKLDGERMQMHMTPDDSVPGGRAFRFWSRKAKEYTYLYGKTLFDQDSSLTRYLKESFPDEVESIILDGEMITWDMDQDRICAFGTLKTAALAEKKNEFALTPRPLFRVFDILLLNDQPLTQYVLRDRRKALERAVKPVHRRLELHPYTAATTTEEVEARLREIIDDAAEGLVLKNPRSSYRLNDRNDDWIKVKPEYMDSFGENLDCVVIGGYYGSGRRGNMLSSYLLGLRMDDKKAGSNPEKCVSFFKVGGGMTANDYAHIKHLTDGKWLPWDQKNPPTDWIELAGGKLQRERPDVWIKPSDSIVIEAKAASIAPSDEFAMGLTLRFPRFTRMRQDRDWQSALSIQGLLDLKANIEQTAREKKMKVDESKKKRRKVERQKPLKVAGYARGADVAKVNGNAELGSVFNDLCFYVMTECSTPVKKTKIELETLIKAHGGRIVQSHTIKDTTVNCIADRNTVKVASLRKRGDTPIIKAAWIFDCINQAEIDFAHGRPERVVLWEPERHLYFASPEDLEVVATNVDQYNDPYYRDTTVAELRTLMAKMAPMSSIPSRESDKLHEQWDSENFPGWMFTGKVLMFDNSNDASEDQQMVSAKTFASFAGAEIANDIETPGVTHVVVGKDSDVRAIRKTLSGRKKLPRIVTAACVNDSWREKTLIDEQRFVP